MYCGRTFSALIARVFEHLAAVKIFCGEGPRGALPYKAIRDVPFFTVSA